MSCLLIKIIIALKENSLFYDKMSQMSKTVSFLIVTVLIGRCVAFHCGDLVGGSLEVAVPTVKCLVVA